MNSRSQPLGLAGPSYMSRSLSVDAERTVNFYPELVESGRGKTNVALYRVPGLAEYVDSGNAAINRGQLVKGGALYTVIGAKVYKVTTSPSIAEITNTGGSVASIANDSLPVAMHANLAGQILLISNATGYTISASDVVTAIGDADFPASPRDGEFLDSYGVVIANSNQRLYFSSLNDFTAWDALDFFAVESEPGEPRALLRETRELYVFCDNLTAVFYNSGGDPPIVPRPGGIIPYGIRAKNSRAKIGGTLFWLSQDRNGQNIVVKCRGYQAERFSDHALEEAMRGYATTSDAIGFCEQTNGHDFYWLIFPTAGTCWVGDPAMPPGARWHERLDYSGGNFAIHPAINQAQFNGLSIVGHRSNGKLYTMAHGTGTFVSNQIHLLRRAPHIVKGRSKVFYNRIDAHVEREPSQSVAATLKVSDDGGKTFDAGRAMSATQIAGGDLYELSLTRLGQSLRGRTFQFESDSNIRALIEAYVDAE